MNTAWVPVLLPLVLGPAAWWLSGRAAAGRRRLVVGTLGTLGLLATVAAAAVAASTHQRTVAALGPGWTLTLDVTPLAGVVGVLVPAVAAVVVAYAARHEEQRGLGRLVGGLLAFTGAMELLVLAGDLLTLLLGWELVGAASYALISHEWRDPSVPRRAAHAFNATRLGDLGLFVAAGSAFAGVGSLDYVALEALDGAPLQALVAGIVLAAAAKSAQGPFAPWLFSAMAGPTSVSALLHSATMVAAGAYLLARLHPVLDRADWFAPVVIGIGLATALAGGVVAILQQHAKKLLAASTSAQYGLMFVAVGAGFPAAAGAHLVTHAVLKSLLFLVAGIAIAATGSATLARHRLGSHLPVVAGASLVGALSLAAVPPLGAAWTKEELVAAAGHWAPWLAVALAVAGGLASAYAARFHRLAYGRTDGDARSLRGPDRTERAAVATLAAAAVGTGVLFLPGAAGVVAGLFGAALAPGKPWELVVSLLLVATGGWAVVVADRRGRLGSLGATGGPARAARWLGLSAVIRRLVVGPSLRLADAAARFDDRVVDGGVRATSAAGVLLSGLVSGRSTTRRPGVEGVADRVVAAVAAGTRGAAELAARGPEEVVDGVVGAVASATRRAAHLAAAAVERVVDAVVDGTAIGVGALGRDARRLQTGLVHHYYVLVLVGLVLAVAAAAIWR